MRPSLCVRACALDVVGTRLFDGPVIRVPVLVTFMGITLACLSFFPSCQDSYAIGTWKDLDQPSRLIPVYHPRRRVRPL